MRSYRLNCPKLSAVAWFSRPGSQRRICDRHKPDELTKLDAITAEFVFFSVSLSLSLIFGGQSRQCNRKWVGELESIFQVPGRVGHFQQGEVHSLQRLREGLTESIAARIALEMPMSHFFSAGNVRWKSLTLCAKVGSTKPTVIFDTTIFQQRVLLATSDNFLLFELAHVLNLLEVLCHQPLPHKL